MVAEIGNFQYKEFELDSWVVATFVVGFLLFCPGVPFQSIDGEFFHIQKDLQVCFSYNRQRPDDLLLQAPQDNIRGLLQLWRNFL